MIQTATMKFCDPRLVAQYQDEPLEDQAREVMRALIGGLAMTSPGAVGSSLEL